MANRNIIIVGRANSVTRLSYDTVARKASAVDYSPVVGAEVLGSTRINCLGVVLHTLEQLAEKDMTKDTSPTVIYTVGMVVDCINDGTFKYWLLNGGKKLSGEAVNETELGLWKQFIEIYAKIYTFVTFKNVSTVKIPRNPRYAISMEQRALSEYAEKAWDRVKVTAPEIEETGDETL